MQHQVERNLRPQAMSACAHATHWQEAVKLVIPTGRNIVGAVASMLHPKVFREADFRGFSGHICEQSDCFSGPGTVKSHEEE